MLKYEVDGSKYTMHYSKLREDYVRFTLMSDDDFMFNLVEILHFAVFVCFLKEAPSYVVLSDKGVIHELVHLLHYGRSDEGWDETFDVRIGKIRDSFNRWCCLA